VPRETTYRGYRIEFRSCEPVRPPPRVHALAGGRLDAVALGAVLQGGAGVACRIGVSSLRHPFLDAIAGPRLDWRTRPVGGGAAIRPSVRACYLAFVACLLWPLAVSVPNSISGRRFSRTKAAPPEARFEFEW
jgi:hypothetical protein